MFIAKVKFLSPPAETNVDLAESALTKLAKVPALSQISFVRLTVRVVVEGRTH